MKKMENFLRRALSMLLSICMLFGNMGGVLAESVPSVVSESTGPLIDYVDFNGEGINASVNLTYVGTSDYVWNGSAYTTLDDYNVWYWVDLSVAKEDNGWMQTAQVVLDAGTTLTGTPSVSLYRGDSSDSVDMDTQIGVGGYWDNYQLNVTTEGSKVTLQVANYGFNYGFGNGSDYGLQPGTYRFLVGLPISDDQVADMLANGTTFTSKAGSIAVNGYAGMNSSKTTNYTVSFEPTIRKTAEKVTQGADTYIRWTLYYTSGIKLHNTVVVDSLSCATDDNPGHYVTKWNQQIASQNAIQAYDHGYLISAGEKFSNGDKTVTFNLTGANEGSGYTDLRYLYTTDMKLVYHSKVVKHLIEQGKINDIVSTTVLTPNGFAGAELNEAHGLLGTMKEVTVNLQRITDGGAAELLENQDGNSQIWLVMANADTTTCSQSAVRATKQSTGVYQGTIAYSDTIPVLNVTTTQHFNQSILYADGEYVYINVDNDNNKKENTDRFLVEVDDNGTTAVVNLTNYIQTENVNVVFKRNDAATGTTTDAEFTSWSAPALYAVMMDADGNAVSDVTPLTGVASNNILTYNGVLSAPGDAVAHVALLTLKPNKQYDQNNPAFDADKYNVHDGLTAETSTIEVNMDTDSNLSVYETFAVNVTEDAATNGTLIQLVNNIETKPVTVKIQSYDETTDTTTPVAPQNEDDPALYLVWLDDEGNALGHVSKLTKTATGTYTANMAIPAGTEGTLNVLTLKEQKSYNPVYNADSYDHFYMGKTENNTVAIECTGVDSNNNSSISMDEFFGLNVTETESGTVVELTNNRASALQGLVDAYNGGKLEINEETGSFADYDGGKYFNELSPIGIAGSFHLVAFDTANLNTHTNGNVLAKNLNAGSNFGTNGYEFELSYVENYINVHETSASSLDHILALGAGNELAVSNDGTNISVGVNGKTIIKPKNVIIDKDPAKPFISLTDVEAEVRGLSATLASNNENVGISEDFNKSDGRKYLRLTSSSGAGYYNIPAGSLGALGPNLSLCFTDQNAGSIVVNVNCAGVSEVNMPNEALVNINGENKGTNEVTTFENGKVIWNFYNVAEGTVINANQMTGMIIAPGATVNLGSNVNGTVIADTINVNAESHRTDFTGTTTPASGAFSAVKKVNGNTPASDEKFWFALEEDNGDGTWTRIEKVQNNGSKIEFSNIVYTQAGNHTYRIIELNEGVADGYTVSDKVYYMKVEVFANTALGNTALGKNYTFWSEDNQQLGSNEQFIFNNAKDTVDLVIIKQDVEDQTVLEGAVFELSLNGTVIATVTTNDQGRASFSNLEDGTYTLTEITAPDGYQMPSPNSWTFTKSGTTYTGTFENASINGMEITVDNVKEETLSLTGKKTWNDNNNLNGNRPDTITIRLWADGVEVASKTVAATNNVTWTFADLPVENEDGTEINYTITEDAITGYTSKVNGYDVVNTEETTSVSGKKTWTGDSNVASLTRPASITVRLWNGNTQVGVKTVTSANDWSYEFTNLPKYINKQQVTYTVTEDEVPGYTTTVTGSNVTNTLITTKLEGQKTWNDQNNLYGLRPASITVTLKKTVNNTTSVVKTATTGVGFNWAWSFDDLHTKERGADGNFYDVTYFVEEVAVPGYTVSGDNRNLINTLETVDISGTKTWNDQDNAFDTRPDSITINLLQNGYEVKDVTTNAAAGWAWSFTALPKYDAQGNAYNYTVSEDVVHGYLTTYDQDSRIVINTLETKELSGTKTWSDENDRYGLRPNSVTIQIKRGGSVIDSVEATAANNWVWSVTGLPKYDKTTGNEIFYDIEELPVTGYASVISGMNINNVLDSIDLSGTKTWIGDEGFEDVTRPDSITITAMKDGEAVKSTTATKANGWAWTIEDLPMYNADGTEASYYIEEAPVTGYITEEIVRDEETGEFCITNSVVTTEVYVEKVWSDKNNADNTRTDIQVQLYADGTAVGDPVTLSGDNMAHTWTDLPELNADGIEIDYTVDEVSVPNGYVKIITGDKTTGFTIKNTYVFGAEAVITAQKTLKSINKLENGQFSFQLLDAEGKVLQTVSNDAAGAVAFDAISYDQAGVYTYTIVEVNEGKDGYTYDSSEYTATVTVVQDPDDLQLYTSVAYTLGDKTVDGAVFENEYELKSVSVEISVTKVVTGLKGNENDPDYANAYTFSLVDEQGVVLQTVPNTADTVKFGAIEYTQEDAGKTFTYTVVESGFVSGIVNDTEVKTVTVKVTDDGKGNLETDLVDNAAKVTFTNAYTTIDLNGKKEWIDGNYAGFIRPADIKLTVKDSNGNTVCNRTVSADEDGNWNWSVTDLPKYDEQGKEIIYSVTEEKVNGYTTTQTVADDGFITITNTLDTVDKNGTKEWIDQDNKYNTRPETITIAAMNGDTKIAETTATEANGWKWSFTGLPKYDKTGAEIAYTFVEEPVSGYTTQVEGTTITNTLEVVDVDVTKVWDDENNLEGFRPATITINLLKQVEDNEPEILYTEIVSGNKTDTSWSYSWFGLPKYEGGAVIKYTVTEEIVPNYDTEVEDYTITNSREVEYIEIPVSKIWEDGDNAEGFRPSSVTVQLFKVKGEQKTSVSDKVSLSDDNGWTFTFTGLLKYEDGKEIVYEVVEDAVPNYDTKIDAKDDGSAIVYNSRTVEYVKLSGVKIWDDANDQDGFRPEDGIVLVLTENGVPTDTKITVKGENAQWSWSFGDLLKYKNGEEVEYGVQELDVEEYVVEVDTKKAENGDITVTITNTHVPETTAISGTKEWNDDNDRDKLRPESIQINLLANGFAALDQDGNAITTTATGNSWSWSFSDLPVYANGEKIDYTVEENVVPEGYTSQITGSADAGFTVTNTHIVEKTQVAVTKVWNDGNNQDGNRPESIYVQLKADGSNYGNAVELNEGNHWSTSWTELPKNDQGEPINYTVKESRLPAGYISETKLVDNTDGTFTYTITNSYNPAVTQVPVTKVWDDADDQDGLRPESITFQLWQTIDGKTGDDPYATATTTAANWNHTFENLPVKASGLDITYTVTETAVPGYDEPVVEGNMKDGFTVTNTHTPAETDVTATKMWDDASNQDGKRPTSITFHLMADGVKVEGQSKTLSGTDDVWIVTWTDLPKNNKGTEIVYTVEEEMSETAVAEGYKATANGLTVTNEYEPKKTSVSVTKVWEDNGNQDGIRPDSITVSLLADGTEVKDSTVTLNAANNWAHTWEGLDMYKAGKVIAYTVSETSVTDYTTEIKGSATSGYQIVNTHVPAKTEVIGEKTWDDVDDQDGKRPDSITISLKANGTVIKTKTVTEADEWKWSFTGLDKFSGGEKIVYTIEEDRVPDYTTTYSGFNVTNTYTPGKVNVSGTKTWNDNDDQDGKRPDSIIITLYADGEATDKSVTVTKADGWKWNFTDLDEYKNGEKIKYTVVETLDADSVAAGYTISYDGYNVINNYTTKTVDVNGTKIWNDNDDQDGKRPDKITITLYANGEIAKDKDGNAITATVSADANGDWEWSFTGLDMYKAGEEIVYTVRENDVDGYSVEYSEDTNEAAEIIDLTVTNTHEPETVEIKGIKTWVDDNNRDGIRADEITITLYAGDEVKQSLTVSGDSNDWSWSFGELPVYADGEKITYTVKESGVPEGYTSQITGSADAGFTVTNTHTPETVNISGIKDWKDNNNQDGKRTKYVVINLLAGNEKIASTIANEASGWAWSFDNLPKYQTGAVKELITYTVTEEPVETYTTEITGSVEDGFIVTNTHTPETTKVEGSKTWSDKYNQDGKRPASITIRLLANGKEVAVKTVTEADGWKWSFTDLPVYQKGTKLTYTITEDAITDYSTVVSGYDVVNSTGTATTSVNVRKAWDDGSNRDGLQPKSIKVQLLANGTACGDPVTLDSSNNWSYTWIELDKKASGKDIVYTVEEIDVPAGYTAQIAGSQNGGYVITNTHAPETTELEGTKEWIDNNNQDGIRPTSITLKLLANGVEVDRETFTGTGNTWSWKFENLYKYDGGVEIVYTVEEIVPTGYAATYSADTTAITNTHQPEKTQVEGIKKWNDNDNQDGKRPETLTITLYANGAVKDTFTTDAAKNWEWSFTNLDKKANGVDIVYTVSEPSVAGYTGAKTEENGKIVFTNTHEPEKITIEGIKAWSDAQNQDGIRPTTVTINLLKGTEVFKTTTATKEGGWAWKFENLDKYENGAEIVYTVKEVPVPGYEAEQAAEDGQLVITNTHEPEKTTFSGTKIWVDDNNRDNVRPDSVTIKLLADGVDTGNVAYATEANGWTWSFTGLDKYKAEGVAIVYTAQEIVPEGYTVAYADDTKTITNTHELETVDVAGSKTWQDNDNQDGKRPAYITIILLADGDEIARKNVTADDNWSWTFENLPKYQTGEVGQEIVYTINELDVPEYDKLVSGYNVTNTHTPELIDLSGSKTWNDKDDQDGKRPESIQITLLANGSAVRGPIEVTAADNWSWSFKDLPKYADGSEIVYTVAEAPVDEYGTQVNGLNVTNSYTPGKTSISGVKVWNDKNDQDGKRPDSVTINLMKQVGNGAVSATGKSVTLTATTGWNWSFTELDEYEDGKKITYSVTEDAVDPYEVDITTDAETGFVTVTNTYVPETIDFSGSKTWADNDNQDNKRPTSITVRLMADGTEVRNATVGFEEGWAWSFTGLPKYRNGGVEIKYTLTEDKVELYTTTVTGMDVTNSYKPEEVSVDVLKVWDDNNNQDGKRPDSITVQLKADNSDVGDPVTLNEANGWKTEWTQLPKYRNMGTPIVYTVVEDGVPADYTASYSSTTAADGSVSFVITNSDEADKTSISGSKSWNDADNQDGIRPASIVINLLANNVKVDSKTVYPSQSGEWTWKFENLTKYEDGQEIVYTFTEEAVDGYQTTYSDDTTAITNTHKPATVKVEGTKTWEDAGNQDGKRPKEIIINLVADNEIIDTATVTPDADGNWKWSWDNLPEYKVGEQGQKVVYSVTEEPVEHYDTTIDGYNVTNTHVPTTVTVEGSKTWNDANDQDGLRPETIEIQLFANGEYADSQIVSEGTNNWSWKFTDLDEYKDGEKIVYTIQEVVTEKMTTDGYTAQVDGFDVINTYAPETLDIVGSKTWNDADDQDGYRPDSITIRLWADAVNIQTATIEPDANGNWPEWKFEDLPKYRDHGTEIIYKITEDTVDEYSTVIDGFNAINTHEPKTVAFSGSKTWADKDDQDGYRPESIQINLLADGVVVDTITVTEADDWKWSFTDLPWRKDGVDITYTITEEAVEHYTTEINGFSVVNTHITETVDVEGVKTWTDADDQDGKRPAYITINLLADGTEIDQKNVTAADGWKWSWTGLDKFKNGTEIAYTITEDEVAEYTTVITGYDVENIHEVETVVVEGTKTWNDANDQDGKRPTSITINLLADGQIIDSAVIEPDADGNWPGWKFEDLPKYKVGEVGQEVKYTVTENAVEEYTTEVTGYNVLNSYTPGLTSVSVSKAWNDDNDRDGLRPESITFNLLANGIEIDEVVITPDEDGSWPTYTFTDLPIYEVGKVGQKVSYTVTEDPVAGYETSYTGDAATGYYYTNTHVIETVEVAGTKTWTDANDQDGLRPASITINLLADGAVIDTATVTEAEGWSWSFTELPKYRDHGVEIIYTITEDAVAEYTTVITGYDVENIHEAETVEVSGTKTWTDADNQDGKRPASITINLLADGAVVDTATVTEAEGWSWSFTELPKYHDQGIEYLYTITEDAVAEYTTTINGYDVENVHDVELITVAGTKTWNDANDQDGKRPAYITINLLADGVVIDTVNVTAQEGWSWSFTDLPKYKAGEQGVEIVYTITENEVPGYTATITGYDVENLYVPETVDVTGSKTWTDANDQDGKRPDSITINLLADGEVIQTVAVTEAEGWSWNFTGLPKYKVGAVGKEVVYTITEDAVAEYTTVITGYDVENIYVPETVEVAGTKTWNDAGNQDGKRPDSVTINLLANGEKINYLTAAADDNWSWRWTDLPKYENGQEIVYTITEEPVAEYTSVITGYDAENTYVPELISIEGAKTWNDANNQDGVRPESIIIKLMDGSTVVETVTVTEADGWKWTFTDLPKYRPGAVGELMVYTVVEVLDEASAAQYTATVDGYNITNTHEIETVEISGTKVWEDFDNKYLKRPDSITIRLYADGIEIDKAVVTAEDGWAWSFNDLPKYKAGDEGTVIDYTIVEDAVDGYVSAVEGYNVRNTITMVEFVKVDEQTDKRLAGAKFALYEGGAATVGEAAPIEVWTSDLNAKVLAGLKVGQTYTIVETEAPAGFTLMAPFVFTVELTDVPASYRTFTAGNTHVYRFRKLDSSNNGLVSGALLAVMEGNTVIESWYTDTDNDGWYELAANELVPGVVYTLAELEVPAGYLYAEPINFTIDANDGLLIVNGVDTNAAEIVMYDAPAPQVTPTPEPTHTSFSVTKRWEDKDNVLGLRPSSITVHLYRKLSTDAEYPTFPFMTVNISDNGKNVWKFTFHDLPRKNEDGVRYQYVIREEEVPGYVVSYLNNGRTIVNTIPEDAYPPTPTPTLPYYTPTPPPTQRAPQGVKFVDGEWFYIDEYGIPLGGVPMTGDATNFILWGMAIGLPLLVAALAAVEIRRRKKLLASAEQDEEVDSEE